MRHGRQSTKDRHSSSKLRCSLHIAVILLCCCVSRLVGQQQAEVQSSNASQRPSMTFQKIGVAPQDRPACQLPPIATTRRHTPAYQATTEVANGEISHESSSIVNASKNTDDTIISSPSVLSLSSSKISSSKNQLLANRKSDSSERLRQLRQLLVSNNYDAYLVTPSDEHGMEYVSEYDRRLRFISGFSGSNGYALILLDKAVLFTDGRYALQADLDLDCNWWMVVSSDPINDIPQWLKVNAPRGLKVATDARLMSLQVFDTLDDQLRKLESEFVLISQDLVDVVWNAAQADYPRSPSQESIFVHPLRFAGNVSWQEKLQALADEMTELKARHYIISQLDDVAWLLNLRGGDIPMSPLFKCYLFISQVTEPAKANQQQVSSVEQLLLKSSSVRDSMKQSQSMQDPRVLQLQANRSIKVTMYVDLNKINHQIREHLRLDDQNGTVFVSNNRLQQESPAQTLTTRIQIELKDYNIFIMDIRDKLAPSAGTRQLQGKLLLNAAANVAIHVLSKSYDDRLVLVESLVNKLKAVKTDAEVQGMRLAHWRDSLAICMLLSQLDQDIAVKGQTTKWTEISAAKELEFYRSLMDYNRGQSFDSISAYGSNAAIVHYKPSELEPARFISNQSTFLLDTGGQYLDGTTDITRTVHYGEPSDFQREMYTRVLMGAVDLMSLIFESGKQMKIADLIARRHLFELGLDYAHGTGHGIGAFSMVHEAPWLLEHYTAASSQLLASTNKQRSAALQPNGANQPQVLSNPVALQANMFTSVEPGYYKANDFGIRLENIVVTQRMGHPGPQSQRPNDRQPEGIVQRQPTNDSTDQKEFLRFEPISLVPFEPKLIKFELLSNKQKSWINSYNLMIRFRLTQQINYYLAKILNMSSGNQDNQQQQQQQSTTTSKIYSNTNGLQQPANRPIAVSAVNDSQWVSNAQFGYYNFLRLEGSHLQRKLEQAHKWIMAKTEIIPLDVPQSLVANNQQANRQTTLNNQDTGRSADNNLQGRRLIYAYMSSLPFNDAEASELIASDTNYPLNGRHSNGTQSTKEGQTSNQVTNKANKCSGIECDLMVLGALNLHQQIVSRAANQRNQRWPQDSMINDSDFINGETTSMISPDVSFGSIMDAFKLNGSNNGNANSISVWSMLVLSSFVVLQLGILSYVCRNGRDSSTSNQSINNTSSSSSGGLFNWFSRSPRGPSQVVGLMPLQQQQSSPSSSSRLRSPTTPKVSVGATRLDTISVAD